MKKFTWTTFIGFALAAIGILLIIVFSFSKAFNDGSGIFNATIANNWLRTKM